MCPIRLKRTIICWLERIKFCVASGVPQSKKIEAKHHVGTGLSWLTMTSTYSITVSKTAILLASVNQLQFASLFLARAEYTDTQ